MTIPFPELRHDRDIAVQLGCSKDDLRRFTDVQHQAELYEQLQIPKKRRKGQFRVVYRCSSQMLQRIHKTIGSALAAQAAFPECVQGFVRKRSIRSNASRHLGKRIVLHADIEHFFEEITHADVVLAFESLGCARPIAETFASLCTLRGFLPQGAHCSPVIANLVCRRLDDDLLELAARWGATYTRYVDDIIFSGDTVPSETDVRTAFARYGFNLRDGHCRVMRRGRAQFVTGLSVTAESGPRVARTMKRRLRLELYYAAAFGIVDHLARTKQRQTPREAFMRLHGHVRFLSSIEPAASAWYWRQLERVRETLPP